MKTLNKLCAEYFNHQFLNKHDWYPQAESAASPLPIRENSFFRGWRNSIVRGSVWFFEWPWLSGQNGFSTELTKLGGTKPHHPKKHFFPLTNPFSWILSILWIDSLCSPSGQTSFVFLRYAPILSKISPPAFPQKPPLFRPRPPLATNHLLSPEKLV